MQVFGDIVGRAAAVGVAVAVKGLKAVPVIVGKLLPRRFEPVHPQ